MPFDRLSERLKSVASRSLSYCKNKYGGNGVKIEEGIHDSVSWRPTFFLKPSKFLIVAVEVEDNLYPEALKGAAYDISHYDFPISVYQACSLEAYQNDPKQKKINQLRNHGFGIITVDDDGNVVIQHLCAPLAQNISNEQFDKEIKELNNIVKVAFRSAYDVYKTNEGQGLQQAGQIVEALIASLVAEAKKKNLIAASVQQKPLAEQIDTLWAKDEFKPHRAALGGAREFIKEYRNTASHAPHNAKEAADKIRSCKTGFLNSAKIATKLKVVANVMGFPIKIYVL